MVKENQVVKREEEIKEAIERLDKLTVEAAEFSGGIDITKGFSANLQMARLVRGLQEAIRPVMPELMPLMNTPLGFKTDRDPTKSSKCGSPYSEEQLIPIIAEAIIRGVNVTGNQFNVIASGCYITKEGYEYKLKNLKGFSDLAVDFKVPREKPEGCLIECKATWKYHGKEGSLEAEIPVKKNEFMGIDAIYGKAKRKLLARVWERVTNTSIPDGDADEGIIIDDPKSTARPKFEPDRKTTVQRADLPKEKPVAQEPPPTEPAKSTTPPPQPSNQPADVEEIDPNIGAFLDRVMSSDIDPKWFTQALVNNNILTAGQSLKDISPAWAKSAVSASNWPKIFTAAKRLSEGGGK